MSPVQLIRHLQKNTQVGVAEFPLSFACHVAEDGKLTLSPTWVVHPSFESYCNYYCFVDGTWQSVASFPPLRLKSNEFEGEASDVVQQLCGG
jgi:hypothetical protein